MNTSIQELAPKQIETRIEYTEYATVKNLSPLVIDYLNSARHQFLINGQWESVGSSITSSDNDREKSLELLKEKIKEQWNEDFEIPKIKEAC